MVQGLDLACEHHNGITISRLELSKFETFEIESLHIKSDSFVFAFSKSIIFNITCHQRFKNIHNY